MRFKILHASQLSKPQFEQMHRLMSAYYLDIPLEQFGRDLHEKTDIILLFDSEGTIRGFSTILRINKEIAGKKISGVFSGDTVLEKKFWGNRALTIAFGLYLAKIVFSNPFRSHYWFLMSKGYKTYLLMTNNTLEYYPRVDCETPAEMKELMDAFYGDRFGSDYDSKNGLVTPSGFRTRLRHKVADIEAWHLDNKHIRFFGEKNPGWKNGIELTCVSRIKVISVVSFVFTLSLRQLKKIFVRAKKSKGIAETHAF